MEEIILTKFNGFDWDDGNISKNWEKHSVLPSECEEVFFNKPILLYEDIKHSIQEKRAYVLGKTNSNRQLFIVFTMRSENVRIISARDMNRREREIYDETQEIT
jgi:uncharacterized protein